MIRYTGKSKGLLELLKSEFAQQLVDEHAQSVVDACGDGYVADGRQGENRYRVIVYADTWSAKYDDHRNNTMVRTLG
ncbi:hypothetical protein [Corynebacterium cystitidis]|uniref:hypothetical protein n=1 Tax=Corynebacterium cystitidis TaxID=35757 RepID=UPI00211F4560|nr:hypothetical protein [Corynebacterium cystitidis]